MTTQARRLGLIERFLDHAERQPQATAFRFLEDGQLSSSWDYQYLLTRVQALSAVLRRSTTAADRVLLFYPHSLEFIAAFLACLGSGVIAVPSLPPRRSKSSSRITRLIDSCKPTTLLADSSIRRFLNEADLRSMGISHFHYTDEIPNSFDSTDALRIPNPDDIAFLQYTSGSTGSPRGVMVTHANIIHNQMLIRDHFQHDARSSVVSWLPLYHDMGLIGNVLQPLYMGFPSTLFSPVEFLQNPVSWLQAISTYKATTSGAPNFAFDLCVKRVTEEQKAGLSLSSLKVLYNGAEPIRADTLRRFSEYYRPQGLSNAALMTCYGLAESTLFVSGGPAGSRISQKQSPAGPHEIPKTYVSSGLIPTEVLVTIVDPQKKLPLPDGMVGEIWVHSDSVAAGYWNSHEATKEFFQAKLADKSPTQYLRTGDLGFIEKDELFVTGRLKDLIIIRGRNIYPQDIEECVEKALPFLTPNTCAAFDYQAPEGERIGIVIQGTRHHVTTAREKGGKADEDFQEIVDRVTLAISEQFDIAPGGIAILKPGDFPITSSGKVQRGLCRSIFQQDTAIIPLYSFQASNSNIYVVDGKPKTLSPTEQIIHDEVLAWVRRERDKHVKTISPTTSLLTLGVDSTAIFEIALPLTQKLGRDFDAKIFIEHKTIRELAAHLDAPGKKKQETQPVKVNVSPKTRSDSRKHFANLNQRAAGMKANDTYFYERELEENSGTYVQYRGKRLLMLGSYSYLGLVGHPEVNAAAKAAIDQYGTGSHGARLLTGTTLLHKTLEQELAQFLGAEDSLLFNAGFGTNQSVIPALVGPDGCVIGDEFNHASIVDGCNSIKDRFYAFRHNHMPDLEHKLQANQHRRTLVVVDAVYSMEGDIAPLPEIVRLCHKYDALLMVDEAHSFGVLGKTGRGICEHFNLPLDTVDVRMGTLSKTLGACGGFITAHKEIIDYLRHAARSYVFSVAAPPPVVASALASLRILKREPERVEKLRQLTAGYYNELKTIPGIKLTASETPIVPIILPDELTTLRWTAKCLEKGIYVVPIFHPAVPVNAPRIRSCVIASHTEADLSNAVAVFRDLAKQ